MPPFAEAASVNTQILLINEVTKQSYHKKNKAPITGGFTDPEESYLGGGLILNQVQELYINVRLFEMCSKWSISRTGYQ